MDIDRQIKLAKDLYKDSGLKLDKSSSERNFKKWEDEFSLIPERVKSLSVNTLRLFRRYIVFKNADRRIDLQLKKPNCDFNEYYISFHREKGIKIKEPLADAIKRYILTLNDDFIEWIVNKELCEELNEVYRLDDKNRVIIDFIDEEISWKAENPSYENNPKLTKKPTLREIYGYLYKTGKFKKYFDTIPKNVKTKKAKRIFLITQLKDDGYIDILKINSGTHRNQLNILIDLCESNIKEPSEYLPSNNDLERISFNISNKRIQQLKHYFND